MAVVEDTLVQLEAVSSSSSTANNRNTAGNSSKEGMGINGNSRVLLNSSISKAAGVDHLNRVDGTIHLLRETIKRLLPLSPSLRRE